MSTTAEVTPTNESDSILGPTPAPDPEARAKAEATPGQGWKLHLNFDPNNAETVNAINTFLQGLQTSNEVDAFKIGNGGGEGAGEPGKEATVATGSLDRSIRASELIEQAIGSHLLAPAGETLRDDVPVSASGNVWGRFEVQKVEKTLTDSREDGVQLLKDDVAQLMFGDGSAAPSNQVLRDRALVYVQGTYGEFFDGTQTHYADLLARKQEYLAGQEV